MAAAGAHLPYPDVGDEPETEPKEVGDLNMETTTDPKSGRLLVANFKFQIPDFFVLIQADPGPDDWFDFCSPTKTDALLGVPLGTGEWKVRLNVRMMYARQRRKCIKFEVHTFLKSLNRAAEYDADLKATSFSAVAFDGDEKHILTCPKPVISTNATGWQTACCAKKLEVPRVSLKDKDGFCIQFSFLFPDCKYSRSFRPPVSFLEATRQSLKSMCIVLQELYQSQQLTDFVITCKGKKSKSATKFKVHRLVLASNSEFFRNMLSYDMKENRQGECMINDVEPEAVKVMVDYLYKLPIQEAVKGKAFEVFAVADKYQLLELRQMCGQAIFETLKAENAADIFLFASDHCMPEVAEKVVAFVRDNFDAVTEAGGFHAVIENASPGASMDFLKRFGKHLDNIKRSGDPVPNSPTKKARIE